MSTESSIRTDNEKRSPAILMAQTLELDFPKVRQFTQHR